MSDAGRTSARTKLQEDGASEATIATFLHHYDALAGGATGMIPEETIEPLTDLPQLDNLHIAEEQAREALAATVMIRLNGGLGTSMGLAGPKSVLPVRDGASFLDLIVRQVLATRERYGVRLPLLLMNSFSTQEDTLAALAKYPELPVDGLPLDFVQSREPKLREDDLTPVTWEADPELEWCPPGHGDIYPALHGSGVLDALQEAGFRYAMVANSDNLGATVDPQVAGWFASTGAPYAAEVTPRTPMDRKGGHLARRRSDGRIVLRETAQTPEDELVHFMDETRHPYAHTNNLWFDLRALRDVLAANGGIVPLQLIKNRKTVDPRDPASTPVIQIESAMGAAVEVFDGATALVVPRSRFLPVKTTNELMLLRSDAYDLHDDGTLTLRVEKAPVITLDKKVYGKIDDFDARTPDGVPSLLRANSLTVEGDWTFEAGVAVVGDAILPDEGKPRTVAAGTTLGAEG